MRFLDQSVSRLFNTMNSNNDLCNYLQDSGLLRSPEAIEAFRKIDRRDYLPDSLKEIAYRDQPIKAGYIHLSAPCIYAAIVEALSLRKGNSFLNVGSGTGYLSTVISQLIGKDAINHGCDIQPDVVDLSKKKLQAAEKKVNEGLPLNIDFVTGNGMCIDWKKSRYDRIYAGGRINSDDTFKDQLMQMLEVKGILVAPVDDELVRIERTSDTEFRTQRLAYVCFAALCPPKNEEKAKIVEFPTSCWTPELHHLYPSSFQDAVHTVLLCSHREECSAAMLPNATWIEIFKHLRRDAFFKSAQKAEGSKDEDEESNFVTKFGVVSSLVSFCAGEDNHACSMGVKKV